MNPCTNHPDHAAIEHCEVCGRPLCDLCLWYSDDGRRLCEEHAKAHRDQGGQIQSPTLYEEGIQVREVEDFPDPAPYRGNSHDLRAAAAVVLGLSAMLSMCGGAYCLPVAAVLLAILAVGDASRALDPSRTRTLGWLGLGLSGLSLLPLLLFFCIFFFSFTLAIVSTSGAGP